MKRFIKVFLMCLCLFQLTPISCSATESDVNVSRFNMDNQGRLYFKESETDGRNENSEIGLKYTLGKFANKYFGIITIVLSAGIITSVACFISGCVKLGSTASRPEDHHKTVVGLLWSGLASAALGSISVLFIICYNYFNTVTT